MNTSNHHKEIEYVFIQDLNSESLTVNQFQLAFTAKFQAMHGKLLLDGSVREKYETLTELVCELISQNLITTNSERRTDQPKEVYYFSIEYLLGRLLENNLVNLGIREICEKGLDELGTDLNSLLDQEEDPGLGNGGLGRLAACYLDSMAAMGLAGHGFGLRYRYGLFEQKVINGYQREYPDNWLNGRKYVWEYRRPDESVTVKIGGAVKVKNNGKTQFLLENYERITAVPYDIPIVGYHNQVVNTLRLWSAEFDVSSLTCCSPESDCNNVIAYKHAVESLTDLLYPDDSSYEGKLLRLKQQYFLVSASLQSIIRGFLRGNNKLANLPEKLAFHINDTHPALAIPELMRILLDDCGLTWDEAWGITVGSMSYTNHTVLPEALEKWPVNLVEELLPRISMIINEINERYCREIWDKFPGEWDRIRSMAIIADGQVHMAHLAIAGSHTVNGVAQIHTEILKNSVMNNFYNDSPHKFTNVTNGITHRRWLLTANPLLAELITKTIGPEWVNYPCDLLELAAHAHDVSLIDSLSAVKMKNKVKLADYIKKKYGVTVDTNSIFDSHIKRIHAYKRQLLNVMHIMDLYNRVRENPNLDIVPRTFIFGGKAAPGYYMAKKTIKLICSLAEKINNDKSVRDKIKVLFLENYNVSQAEIIIPASDVSEQISTASREASGTGNMKFMMNGAITIGTLDGANIEIGRLVGSENIFVFGLSAQQVLEHYRHGDYNPWEIYNSDLRVRAVVDQLVNGFFPAAPDEFRNIYESILHHGDEYFLLKDFSPYVDAQDRLASSFRDKQSWQTKCLLNIAHSGWFSGDRTFSEYAIDIWQLDRPIPVWQGCRTADSSLSVFNEVYN